MHTNMMKSEHTSDSFFYFDEFAHGYQEIDNLVGWLETTTSTYSRVTLYTAGHLHTAVPHCSHSRAPIVHTAVPRENNEHGCVYLRCRAVCKLPGCVEGHPWYFRFDTMKADYSHLLYAFKLWLKKWRIVFTAQQDTSAVCIIIIRVCIIIKTRDDCFQTLFIK